MRNVKIIIIILLLPFFSSSKVTLNPDTFWDNVIYGEFNLPEVTVTSIKSTDLYYLAPLLFSECGYEPDLGIIAVGNVVTYRAEVKKRSIKSIILQPGQFDGIHTKNFTDFYKDSGKYHVEQAKKRCIELGKLILKGYRVIPRGIYYYSNECSATDDEHQQYVEPHRYITINNHSFYWNPKLKIQENGKNNRFDYG